MTIQGYENGIRLLQAYNKGLLEKIGRLEREADEVRQERDAAVEQLKAVDVSSYIETSPTVDAVEVVRCKDCKHRGIVSECPMCYTEDSYDEDYGYDYWDVDKTVDDGFCHCGEKKPREVEG